MKGVNIHHCLRLSLEKQVTEDISEPRRDWLACAWAFCMWDWAGTSIILECYYRATSNKNLKPATRPNDEWRGVRTYSNYCNQSKREISERIRVSHNPFRWIRMSHVSKNLVWILAWYCWKARDENTSDFGSRVVASNLNSTAIGIPHPHPRIYLIAIQNGPRRWFCVFFPFRCCYIARSCRCLQCGVH